MLSNMHNDLIGEFEQYTTTQDMWKALKLRYGGTSATRLRGLTMKFDSYKMRSEHTMKQHLRAMSSMIQEFKSTGNNLTDEQQVQAVIRSLPSSWEMMCQNLTHNETIKIFDDVACHLELEAERLEAAKPISSVHMAKTSSRKASRPKRKQPDYAPGQERPNGPSPKKDSAATEHVARDRVKFVEYHRIPVGSKDIKVENGASVKVLGIGTYKLELRGGCTLLLHDVLLGPIGQERMTRLAREGLMGNLAKSEALDCFRRYMRLVENQLNKSIKALRTNRGLKYLFEQFKELCDEKGITR
ncbi:uncharacterized protein LOC142631486 [Castanea sativa]|uniref:uncharacterized protein LOC142631486 n=1 Tax=Castanea sativa TaxID=21020 RepID=UPI003F651F1E